MLPSSGINIGIMTSGGDAQGMNAAIRSVVRRASVLGASVWAIYEGYMGMVSGGEMIRHLKWDDVSGLLPKGGTVIGTSRCAEFRTKEGRRKAVLNLLLHNIDRLVCIGGDGSLTGANILSLEWKEHLQSLVADKLITEEVAQKHQFFVVVGMVGSIDNDFCGSDMTIGCDTALNRIVEAVDALMTTAASHQRSFVVEVMGRNCGWLAAYAALAVGADYAFIPEYPTQDDWREKMCRGIKRGRDLGRRHSIVIVSEGAKDCNGEHISAEDVKNTIEKKLGFETRVTILGHVQRGGAPSNYDRLISTLMGIEAVNACVEADEKTESMVVGIRGGKMVRNRLVDMVKITQSVVKAIEQKQYDQALQLRGPDFVRAWTTYMALCRTSGRSLGTKGNVAVMNVGAPSPGMNASTRALTRLALDAGYNMYGIFESTRGLSEADVRLLNWIDVDSWCDLGGSVLGTNREQPTKNLEKCAANLAKLEIKALFVVGGWEALTTAQALHKGAETHPALRIPIITIPATISNNIPGTDIAIGSDTALNTIVESSDRLKLSAVASRCRVFVMEVHGGKCGYLATAATLGGGGHITYTPENGITLRRLCDDIESLQNRFHSCKTMALIINTEQSSKTYSTEMIERIMVEEAHDNFEVRKLILGHIQQGNSPSPLDRCIAADLAFKALGTAEEYIAKDSKQAVCGSVGTSGNGLIFTHFSDLEQNMDFVNRRPIKQSWDHLVSAIQSLRRVTPLPPATPHPHRLPQPIGSVASPCTQ
jgi:6-phosphofructokinase 1